MDERERVIDGVAFLEAIMRSRLFSVLWPYEVARHLWERRKSSAVLVAAAHGFPFGQRRDEAWALVLALIADSRQQPQATTVVCIVQLGFGTTKLPGLLIALLLAGVV